MDARSDENKGCVVPGRAPKDESRKFILVSVLQAIGEAPGLPASTLYISQQLSLQPLYQLTFTPQNGPILLNLSEKANYKQSVDPIIQQFVWSGYKIRENCTLDAE